MPDPDPASPTYINGWRSRTCPSKPWRSWVFANAASGMTPFLDQSHFYSNDFMSSRKGSPGETQVLLNPKPQVVSGNPVLPIQP